MPVDVVSIPTVDSPLRVAPLIGRAHPEGAAFIVYPLMLLSAHDATFEPDIVMVFESAASSQSCNPGMSWGPNLGDDEDNPINDIFAYRSRIVLHTSRETMSVCVLLLGMMSGLVKFNVLVSVMVSWDEVELRRDQ
jgi:hypothetical protein